MEKWRNKTLLKVVIKLTFYVLGCYFVVTQVCMWGCTSCRATLSKVWPWYAPSANYFWEYLLHLEMVWPMRGNVTTHTKKFGGKCVSWNLSRFITPLFFSETLRMTTHIDWVTWSQAWPQDCRVRITQSARRLCTLFTVFISQNLRPPWKWVMAARYRAKILRNTLTRMAEPMEPIRYVFVDFFKIEAWLCQNYHTYL